MGREERRVNRVGHGSKEMPPRDWQQSSKFSWKKEGGENFSREETEK